MTYNYIKNSLTREERLDLLIEGVNISEDHRYLEPLNQKRLTEIFTVLFGKEKLDKIVHTNDPNTPHLRFWDTRLEKEINDRSLTVLERKNTIDKIEPFYCKSWMLVNLIDKVLEENNVLFAESLINELQNKDSGPSQFVGQRKLLRYYAQKNNVAGFKNTLKLTKPAKSPTSEIHMCKDLMIENFSKENGLEKGITLCRDKVFGEKYCLATIRWMAHLIELHEIEKAIEKYHSFFMSEKFAKEKLFVLHFYNQRPTTIPELDFRKVLNSVLLIDKEIKWGDGRMRDGLVSDLGCSSNDVKQIKECKKNIISPFYKRELNYHLENIMR